MVCTPSKKGALGILEHIEKKAITALSSPNVRFISILLKLQQGKKTTNQITRELREEGLPWRGVRQSLIEMEKIGIIRKENGEYTLTSLGKEMAKGISAVKKDLLQLITASLENSVEEEDIYRQLLTIIASTISIGLLGEEVYDTYRALAIHGYISMMVASTLSCLYEISNSFREALDSIEKTILTSKK